MRAESSSSIFGNPVCYVTKIPPFWPFSCLRGLKTALFTVRQINETSESVGSQRAIERRGSV